MTVRHPDHASPAGPAGRQPEQPRRAPVLVTARLTLSPHAAADLDDLAALWGDAEVVRFLGGYPIEREEVWRRLLRHVGHWALLGFGYWVVRETATGALVGEVGLADHERDLVPPIAGRPECGWTLARAAQGLGLAREAVEAALGWIEASRPAARTVCLVHPDNERSLRLAHRLGYALAASAHYRGEERLLLERPGAAQSP